METGKRQDRNDAFAVEGYADSPKTIVIDGDDAEYVADLGLHRADLQFAADCLRHLDIIDVRQQVLREAVWYAAVSHFCRCFMHGKRHPLDRDSIFGPEGETALEVFDMFVQLRNKQMAHDVSGITQTRTGAILAAPGKPYKIERIVNAQSVGNSLDPRYIKQLHLVVDCATRWVQRSFDAASNHLWDALEAVPYAELLSRPALDMQQVDRGIRATNAYKKQRQSRRGSPSFAWEDRIQNAEPPAEK